MEWFKKNIAIISSLLTFLGTVVGSWIFIDSRYAHAESVAELKQQQNSAVEVLRSQQEHSFKTLRQEGATNQLKLRALVLEDKIFELEVRPKRSVTEQAILDRYKREMTKTTSEMESIKSGM